MPILSIQRRRVKSFHSYHKYSRLFRRIRYLLVVRKKRYKSADFKAHFVAIAKGIFVVLFHIYFIVIHSEHHTRDITK